MRNDDAKVLKTLLWIGIPVLAILALAAAFISANRPPVVRVPSHKLPNLNGWDDFVRAGEIVRTVQLGPYSGLKEPQDWTIAELRTWSQAEAPAFVTLRRGLAKKCVHPPVRSCAYSFKAETDLRELARAAEGLALYYQSIGKPAMAADPLLDVLEAGLAIQHGGPVITALTGNAMESMMLRHLELVLPKLSAKDLEHVANRLQEISKRRVPYSDVLVEEGRALAMMEAELFSQRDRRLTYAVDGGAWYVDRSKREPSAVERVTHSARFALINKSRMIADNQAYFEALAKEQRGPYRGNSKVPLPHNPIAKGLGEAFVRARATFARNEASFATLQTKVALLRYHADKGRYPNSLVELTPAYLKSVPVDPLRNGKPVPYRPENRGRSYAFL